jgi:hypothetical protein
MEEATEHTNIDRIKVLENTIEELVSRLTVYFDKKSESIKEFCQKIGKKRRLTADDIDINTTPIVIEKYKDHSEKIEQLEIKLASLISIFEKETLHNENRFQKIYEHLETNDELKYQFEELKNEINTKNKDIEIANNNIIENYMVIKSTVEKLENGVICID